MERTFFFLGFCPPSIRAVWRGFNSDSVLRKLFSGDIDFRKTETNLFLDFVRAEEGSGEESARASFQILFATDLNKYYDKILTTPLLASTSTNSPSFKTSVAIFVPIMQGFFISRATIAA